MVESFLLKKSVKQDKVTYRSQQMWLDAAGPLTVCLEKAHEGTLTITEAIPMLQSALLLMGNASQHQSFLLRRKQILQHLNLQLKSLMKESNFAGTQPYLFGEDFGAKAKKKLEAAAVLKKAIYPQPSKRKLGFSGGYPHKYSGS